MVIPIARYGKYADCIRELYCTYYIVHIGFCIVMHN